MFNIPKNEITRKSTLRYLRRIKKWNTGRKKAKIEDYFIKTVKDEDSEFYSPMLAGLNEQQLKSMLRQVLFD